MSIMNAGYNGGIYSLTLFYLFRMATRSISACVTIVK